MTISEGTYFGKLTDIQEDSVYDQGFKKWGISPRQQYGGVRGSSLKKSSLVNTVDIVKKSLIKKDAEGSSTYEFASGTNYSTTSGSLPIFPIWVLPEIVETVTLEHPLYNMIAKKAVRGKFIDFNQRTARGAASLKYELASLSATKDTFVRQSIPIKAAYSVRILSGFTVRVNEGYIDILADRIRSATEAMLDLIEEKTFTGDASTYSYEFDGLYNLISTNTDNLSGTAITLDDCRQIKKWCKRGTKTDGVAAGTGKPSLFVCDDSTYEDLKKLIQPFQRYNNVLVVDWGIESFSIDTTPVISNPFLTTVSSSKILYCLDMRTIWYGVLQDLTYQELPFDGDGMKFMIKTYMALTVDAEMFNGYVYGIL